MMPGTGLNLFGVLPCSGHTSCLCVGPQNGEPRCPCAMRKLIVRDGRYIQPEVDLGPVRPEHNGYLTFPPTKRT